jgi:hypothetical protein
MMQQGLSGPAIAYNEYHIAPAASALGRRDGAHEEYLRNRAAAKCARGARVTPKGPAQPPRKPRRMRAVLRSLHRDLAKAQATGDMARFLALRYRFETLMAARAKRLGVGE